MSEGRELPSGSSQVAPEGHARNANERFSPVRESTDDSLRAERRKTDGELASKQAAVEEKADGVVDRAREKADQVVQTARNRADRNTAEQTAPEARRLKEERAGEDNALEAERHHADESVHREREERKQALASLLRLEREETDQHLLMERGFSDEALNTRDIFLAMVSHDLRTMLGGIALNAGLLARGRQGEGDSKQGVSRAEAIQRLTARMNRLIGDLVDVASIESGKLVVQPVQSDLTALVKEVIETFQLNAAAQAITLALENPAPPVLALFDHDRIVQVLANLLGNAIKFTPKGGRVSVRVEALKGEARVSVADTGSGISPHHVEAIFRRFWQVGRADRRGLGLGLYISLCIMEGHGGRIWAESIVGVGSTFFFVVPKPISTPTGTGPVTTRDTD
jgi:signal transduction histidine kinase